MGSKLGPLHIYLSIYTMNIFRPQSALSGALQTELVWMLYNVIQCYTHICKLLLTCSTVWLENMWILSFDTLILRLCLRLTFLLENHSSENELNYWFNTQQTFSETFCWSFVRLTLPRVFQTVTWRKPFRNLYLFPTLLVDWRVLSLRSTMILTGKLWFIVLVAKLTMSE